jgi:AbrB family looped-hinge helix DNA binding protein
MARTKVSSKGQVVLPKSVRDAHGWQAGTELEVIDRPNEVVLRPKSKRDERFPPISVDEFLARRIKVDKPLPNDREIEQTILAEAARRFDATRR